MQLIIGVYPSVLAIKSPLFSLTLEFMIANAILADTSEIEYKEPYKAYENGRKEGSESFLCM